jgi:hypothetical protein
MDPGSAALLEEPSGALRRLSELTGAPFPALHGARARTEAQVADRAAALAGHAELEGLSTCVFGSWGRGELTGGSDDDWAVLVGRPFEEDDKDVRREVLAASKAFGASDRQPGAQDVFGLPFDVTELSRNIGLDADTNTNLTRRMLLLLESRELHGHVRAHAVDEILARYLSHVKPFRPPRFLLNDLVRYWRTICVDFEGKGASPGSDPKWATRNAKLRTSRKLLFAGGLVTVLLCHLMEARDMQRFLARWFDAAPTDRLAAAFLYADVREPGARALAAYDRWIELMESNAARQELTTLSFESREESPLFNEIREIGTAFQAGLDALLFSSALAPVTRKYLIF